MKLSEESFEESEELGEAKSKLSEQTEELLTLRKEVEGMKVAAMVEAKALEFEVDTEREKFRKLAETISFTGDESLFGQKLTVIAESVSDSKEDTRQELDEEQDDSQEEEKLDEKQESTTDRYMKYL
jgi:hypothetical protein